MAQTVCVIAGSHFSAAVGGAQFQAQCIVDELLKRDLDIYYLARNVNPDYKPEGYTIIQIAKPTRLRSLSFALDAPPLLRLLRAIRPDVIYQRALNPYTGIAAYYAQKAGCASVFHIASDSSLLSTKPSRIPGLRTLEKLMSDYGLRHSTNVIAQTQHQADLFLRKYGRRATVVPNFHPMPLEDQSKSDDEIRVIWVANFKVRKRPEIFVRLARDLAHRPDLRFVMIGRPGNPKHYESLHSEIRQTTNLTYTGELPLDEVNRQLASGHIFVNTSTYEGFPNTFIQSWMRRVPTLSFINPDGIFDSGKIGYSAASYEDMKNLLLRLADNRALREKMGNAAREYAVSAHSVNAAKRLIELLC